MIAIVVAHSANRVIGRDGDAAMAAAVGPAPLPRADERPHGADGPAHLRIAARRLPPVARPPQPRALGRPRLPRRRARRCSRRLRDALAACEGDCFVIGGEVTYRDALPLCERLYATEIDGEIDGDAFFPELDPEEWRSSRTPARRPRTSSASRFRTYERAL